MPTKRKRGRTVFGLGVAKVGNVRHDRLLVDARVGELLGREQARDAQPLVSKRHAAIEITRLVRRIKRSMIRAEARRDRIHERAERLAVVPICEAPSSEHVSSGAGTPVAAHRRTFGKALDVVLGDLALYPLEQVILDRCLVAGLATRGDLVPNDERPDETENQLEVAVVDIRVANVDELDALAAHKIERDLRVLVLLVRHARVLVVAADLLGRQHLEQIDEV